MAKVTPDGLPVVTAETMESLSASEMTSEEAMAFLQRLWAQNPNVAFFISAMVNLGDAASQHAFTACAALYRMLASQAQANKMGEEINGSEEEQATAGQGTDK